MAGEYKCCVKALAESLERARNTQTHAYFNELTYMNGNGYLKLNIPDKDKSMIFKARCGLLPLNDVPWRVGTARICSLCNHGSAENIWHFIGVCPVFSSYRLKFFKKRILSESETINILNGGYWLNLRGYIENCLKYRLFLVAEFNF